MVPWRGDRSERGDTVSAARLLLCALGNDAQGCAICTPGISPTQLADP